MIKLGSIKPTVFSDDGGYCLRYNLYSSGLATLINMKNNEENKIHLPKAIAACAISKNGDEIANIDDRGNIYLTDTKSLKTEKITNIFSEFSLAEEAMPRAMFFLDDLNKIVTFIYFEQYKPREEFQCVVVTDLQNKKSEIALKIENSCFLSVEKKSNKFTLFLIMRKPKQQYGFIKFEIPAKITVLNFESAKQYGVDRWYLKNLSPSIFDFSDRYFYGIKMPGVFGIHYKNCCFFDYKNKRVISNEGAVWKGKTFEFINWLPKNNLFLFKLKDIDNYYVGDIESKSVIAGIAFNGFDIDIRKYFPNTEPITINLANKKDFSFTNKSQPINSMYVANDKFIVFGNGKSEFALEMDALMEILEAQSEKVQSRKGSRPLKI